MASHQKFPGEIFNVAQRKIIRKPDSKRFRIKKSQHPSWLSNTGSNVSNVVPSQQNRDESQDWIHLAFPERMAIIIIIICICKAFFRSIQRKITPEKGSPPDILGIWLLVYEIIFSESNG
ncbi:hypothetical protein EFS38_07305 [Dickeya undicola]|uniref:Uncharacterized protein n=1 Tax=Dickeya undicola TaxID=1577887 RepID=A0ABX9WVC1_9GAMM|nr:hypothetical protein [Dickeya undicola]RNM25029.1 hypothetical protein EFS38_07305 [Dickeya undicola]